MYQTDKTNFKANVSKAYSSGSKYLTKSGSYRCMVESAYWEQNNFGGQDLIMNLITEDEKTTKLTINYQDDKGERQYGANVLDALIVITDSKKGLTAAPDTAMVYSWVDKAVVEQDVNGCPELKGKWFEFLLKEKEHAYIAKTGDRAGQVIEQKTLTLSSVFQDKKFLSAIEIMEKVTIPEEYNKQKAYLDANPVFQTNNYKNLVLNANAGSGSYAKKANEPQDDDSELPF